MSDVVDAILKFLKWLWDNLPGPLRLPVVSVLIAPLAMAVGRYYADAVPLRNLPRDPWVLRAAAAALLAALLWSLGSWLYTDITKPKPRATPRGKLGFYLARIEDDPQNRRQHDLMGQLHNAMHADTTLRARVEIHDLIHTIPHGSPDEQAYEGDALIRGLNAAQVIWLVRGQQTDQFYHTVVKASGEGRVQTESRSAAEPRAIWVPPDTEPGRYFAAQAFAALGEHEKAVAQLYPKADSPHRYASELGNLALMYLHLPTGDRSQNLQRAIKAYGNALSLYTREKFPMDWAMTQNNLGVAYRNLPTGDRSENLQKAIAAFENALTVRTREKFPIQWAMTQNNLGDAYANLPTGDRTQNLQNAIAAYQAALTVRTREKFPAEWAMTQNNLGNAYSDLPTGDRSQNLQKAIEAFQAALTIYTQEAFPRENADVRSNLARARKLLEELE